MQNCNGCLQNLPQDIAVWFVFHLPFVLIFEFFAKATHLFMFSPYASRGCFAQGRYYIIFLVLLSSLQTKECVVLSLGSSVDFRASCISVILHENWCHSGLPTSEHATSLSIMRIGSSVYCFVYLCLCPWKIRQPALVHLGC